MKSLTNYFGISVRADAAEAQRMRITRQVEMVLDGDGCCPPDKLTYRNGQLVEALIWHTDQQKLRAHARYLFGPTGLRIDPRPMRHDPRIALFSHAKR